MSENEFEPRMSAGWIETLVDISKVRTIGYSECHFIQAIGFEASRGKRYQEWQR